MSLVRTGESGERFQMCLQIRKLREASKALASESILNAIPDNTVAIQVAASLFQLIKSWGSKAVVDRRSIPMYSRGSIVVGCLQPS